MPDNNLTGHSAGRKGIYDCLVAFLLARSKTGWRGGSSQLARQVRTSLYHMKGDGYGSNSRPPIAFSPTGVTGIVGAPRWLASNEQAQNACQKMGK